MVHHRQQIRDAVAAVLVAADTRAAANVFTSRSRPILEILQKRESVLSIYTSDENSERSPDSYNLVRTLTVSIEGAAGGGDDLDDTLDTLASEVEAAIDADPTLGNLLHRELILQGTVSEISAKGNMQVGAFRLDYECQYVTQIAAADEPGVLPSLVYVTPRPNRDRYSEVLGGTDADGDGCVDGVCDPDAYGGDLTDDNIVRGTGP
jgi:hypothetical protein